MLIKFKNLSAGRDRRVMLVPKQGAFEPIDESPDNPTVGVDEDGRLTFCLSPDTIPPPTNLRYVGHIFAADVMPNSYGLVKYDDVEYPPAIHSEDGYFLARLPQNIVDGKKLEVTTTRRETPHTDDAASGSAIFTDTYDDDTVRSQSDYLYIDGDGGFDRSKTPMFFAGIEGVALSDDEMNLLAFQKLLAAKGIMSEIIETSKILPIIDSADAGLPAQFSWSLTGEGGISLLYPATKIVNVTLESGTLPVWLRFDPDWTLTIAAATIPGNSFEFNAMLTDDLGIKHYVVGNHITIE